MTILGEQQALIDEWGDLTKRIHHLRGLISEADCGHPRSHECALLGKQFQFMRVYAAILLERICLFTNLTTGDTQ